MVKHVYTQQPQGLWAPRPQRPFPRYNQNLENVHTGGWRRGSWGRLESTRGYGIDLNRNGRFDRGRDGVLVFDFNRDGRHDKKEVATTNMMMKAARGNYDFDGNGKVSFFEKVMAKKFRHKYGQLDQNRDGQLSSYEISQGGGRLWVDRNRNGQIGHHETHSVFHIPDRFGRGSTRLDSVDPYSRLSRTSRRPGRMLWRERPPVWGNGNQWGNRHDMLHRYPQMPPYHQCGCQMHSY